MNRQPDFYHTFIFFTRGDHERNHFGSLANFKSNLFAHIRKSDFQLESSETNSQFFKSPLVGYSVKENLHMNLMKRVR